MAKLAAAIRNRPSDGVFGQSRDRTDVGVHSAIALDALGITVSGK